MSIPLTQPPDKSITEDDWSETPDSVRAYVLKLVEQQGRNSRNSSQPPSQDSPRQKQEKQVEKPKSTRRRGAQDGHAGQGRELMPADAVDEIVVYRPEVCQTCGERLSEEEPAPYRYQVTDIPVVNARVVEHQVHRIVCPACQTENRGSLGADIAASQFGPQVVSLMAVLMGLYRLSKRQVVSLLRDCYGVEIAVGSVVNQQYAVSQALAAPVQQVQTYVQQQAACNMDETRWRERGQPKTGWLWVVVTQVVTLFQVALSRSQEVAKTLLGETYDGVVGSDRAGCYTWLKVNHRQVCWSHLLRDFQAMLERGGDSFIVGTNLKLQGEYVLALWARARDDPAQRTAFLTELPAIQQRVHDWLTQGAAASDSRTAATCVNLLALQPALWAFATQSGVEPTNNAAERALRHPVIWRRLSHGTHSPQGSLFVERILTTVASCHQQDRDCLDFIRQAVIAHRLGQPAPSLLPFPCGVVFVTP